MQTKTAKKENERKIMEKKLIYFDYAATTSLDSEVLEKMLPYYKENYGNADSLHAFGRKAQAAVAKW